MVTLLLGEPERACSIGLGEATRHFQLGEGNHHAKTAVRKNLEPIQTHEILVEQMGIKIICAQQCYQGQPIEIVASTFHATHDVLRDPR